MASSIFIYGEKSFWVSDWYLQALYCYLIVKVIADNNGKNKEFYKELEWKIAGYFLGALGLDINKYSNIEINQLKSYLQTVKIDLNNNEVYSLIELNMIRNKVLELDESYFEFKIDKEMLLKLTCNILELISDKPNNDLQDLLK
jgi:hypothetical protein